MSDNTHYSDTFPRSDLFAGVTTEKQTDISNRGHRIPFKSGETLFREGEPALKCYFVLNGRLKMSNHYLTAISRPIFIESSLGRSDIEFGLGEEEN